MNINYVRDSSVKGIKHYIRIRINAIHLSSQLTGYLELEQIHQN